MKKGFTMIEILVAMVILVMVFALLTVLYVRASKIRRVITAQNDVQEVLSQMMDRIVHGDKNTLGLIYASNLNSAVDNPTSIDISPYVIVFSDNTGGNTVIYGIAPGATAGNPDFSSTDTDTTLWRYDTTAGWLSLDVNNKILLESGSKFEYYNSNGQNLIEESISSETTLVKITLKGKSTEPAMKNMTPVTLHSAVRLRNKLSF